MDSILEFPGVNAEFFPNGYYYGHSDGEISIEDFESFIKHPFNRDKKFELIDGRLVLMAGNASSNHQRIIANMTIDIGHYLKGKKCEVFNDLNLYLFKEDLGECKDMYQPDILICCDKRKITKKGCEGVPDLIVEVISKSTGSYDYTKKFVNYIKYGVREYWIADMFRNKIFVYVNQEKSNLMLNEYTFYDKAESVIFPGLSVDFTEILEKLDKSELEWFKGE